MSYSSPEMEQKIHRTMDGIRAALEESCEDVVVFSLEDELATWFALERLVVLGEVEKVTRWPEAIHEGVVFVPHESPLPSPEDLERLKNVRLVIAPLAWTNG